MNEPGVMQMVDTLSIGGLERVAVNLANLLPRERYSSHLCTTRADGPLSEALLSDVGRLQLDRTRRLELRALRRISVYCKNNNVSIIHAHGSALLVAILASMLPPYPKVVWHVHYGALATKQKLTLIYWLLTKRVAAVLTVNEALATWSREKLQIPAERVHYVRNFVCTGATATPTDELPGRKGSRIVCVANLRPQKDHLTLIRAMSVVVQAVPDATLLLLGATTYAQQLQKIQYEISRNDLHNHVHILGSRQDVAKVLSACDIGVLSSVSEGLPLALIEYGMAGLAVVATDVGQCAEVLDGGQAGLLVSPQDSHDLASALLRILCESDERLALSARFQKHVMENYSSETAMKKVCAIYQQVLA